MSNKQPTIFAKKVVEISFVAVLLIGIATGVVLVSREQDITGRAGLNVKDIKPPMVAVFNPENGATLDMNSTYTVSAQAEDDSEIVKTISLYIQDELLHTCEGNFCQAQFHSSSYEPGTYEISAEATDTEGNVGSDTIQVTIQ